MVEVGVVRGSTLSTELLGLRKLQTLTGKVAWQQQTVQVLNDLQAGTIKTPGKCSLKPAAARERIDVVCREI